MNPGMVAMVFVMPISTPCGRDGSATVRRRRKRQPRSSMTAYWIALLNWPDVIHIVKCRQRNGRKNTHSATWEMERKADKKGSERAPKGKRQGQ